jgi:hypothetical protein
LALGTSSLVQEVVDRYAEGESSYRRSTLVFGLPLALIFISSWLYFPAVWVGSWFVCRHHEGFMGWLVWPFIGPLDLTVRILRFLGKEAELPRCMKLRSA